MVKPPDAREALRARCRTAARERWNWEREASGLVGLYEDLAVVGDLAPALVPGPANTSVAQ